MRGGGKTSNDLLDFISIEVLFVSCESELRENVGFFSAASHNESAL